MKININASSNVIDSFKDLCSDAGFTYGEGLRFLMWRHTANDSRQLQGGALRRFTIQLEREIANANKAQMAIDMQGKEVQS